MIVYWPVIREHGYAIAELTVSEPVSQWANYYWVHTAQLVDPHHEMPNFTPPTAVLIEHCSNTIAQAASVAIEMATAHGHRLQAELILVQDNIRHLEHQLQYEFDRPVGG